MSEPDDGHIQIIEPAERTTLQKVSQDNQVKEKTRDGLLHILDDSFTDYNQIALTEQESTKLSKTLKRLSTGASSFSTLTCKGAECPFASKCPLVQMKSETRHGKAPVGQDCILEATLLRDALTSYIQEYEVDPSNYTEVNIVAELAEIETLLWRINMQLSSGSNSLFVIDQPIGFDRQTGAPIVQKQIDPLFEQKQKLNNRKSKLMKLMVGDRQEKYKKEAALKQKPAQDASSQMSEVKRQIQALQQKVKAATDSSIQDAQILSPEDFMLGDDKK